MKFLKIVIYRAKFNHAMRNLHYAKSPYSTEHDKIIYAKSVGCILSEIGLINGVTQ